MEPEIHPREGRPRAQPQERLAGDPEEEAGGLHRGVRVAARARSPSTPSTPRASAATSRASPPTPGSSSGRWRSRKYDTLRGLSPTISIEQKAASNNPRSTVGTITEIHDYLRVLFASIGVQHCHQLRAQGRQAERAADRGRDPRAARGHEAACCWRRWSSNRKGEHKDVLADAQKRGFARARVDGKVREPRGATIELDKKRKHDIALVVDRLVLKADVRSRGSPTRWRRRSREGKGIAHRHRRARARRDADAS